MIKKSILALSASFALAALPLVSFAQSNSNNAPLGSKENPIKPTSVTPGHASNNTSAKGKRGSKTNPIAGTVHPRNTN